MDFSAIGEALKALGIDPAAAGLCFPFAYLLRVGRASFRRFGPGQTYLAACGFGALEAAVRSQAAGAWGGVLDQALAYAAVTLIIQMVLQQLSKQLNLPWLPRDNDWAMAKSPDK